MDFSQMLAQALSGGGQQGGQGGQGGVGGLFQGWKQDDGSGMSAYNPNPSPFLPAHSSNILSAIMGDGQPQNPFGGGLAAILQRLGINFGPMQR